MKDHCCRYVARCILGTFKHILIAFKIGLG